MDQQQASPLQEQPPTISKKKKRPPPLVQKPVSPREKSVEIREDVVEVEPSQQMTLEAELQEVRERLEDLMMMIQKAEKDAGVNKGELVFYQSNNHEDQSHRHHNVAVVDEVGHEGNQCWNVIGFNWLGRFFQ